MKIKNLLLTGMCALTMGAFAADEGTILYYEDFGTQEYHQGTDASTTGELKANSNEAIAAYKVDGNFYFPEAFFVHGNWGIEQTYPGASQGSVLAIVKDAESNYPEFNIKVNTSSKPYAVFSYAHSRNAWAEGSSTVKASYSFDKGATWTEFSYETANIASSGAYDLVQHSANIGGKDCVYLKIEWVDGSGMIDDVKVMGYAEVPVNKFALNGAISEATNFVSTSGTDASYCIMDLMNFQSTDIAEAQAVADKADATQEEVDAAVTKLNEALEALKATQLDFTAINEAITAGNAKKEEAEYANYPADDRSAMETALEAAKTITSGGCVTQDEVNTAATTLNEAVQKLIPTSIDGNTDASEIKLYPNPANDYIKIDGVEGETVYIVTVDGKTVKVINNYNGSTIGISNLTSGVYTVVVGDNTISFIKK